MPGGITGSGGRFQQIHGVNEQQDFSNGLKTMTATDAADSPFSRILGERFSPSQVYVGGNSRKSSEMMSGSMVTFMEQEDNKRIPSLVLSCPIFNTATELPACHSSLSFTLCTDPRIFIVS
jgi:hypothetical protein